GLPLALRQPFARQYSARRQFSWTYLESVTICMRRSPDLEPCSRTHRCAQIHARSSIRLFVDSWKPTSCRASSGRFHSIGYSTQTANPLLPPGFSKHEPSTYNFSACGSKDTALSYCQDSLRRNNVKRQWFYPWVRGLRRCWCKVQPQGVLPLGTGCDTMRL